MHFVSRLTCAAAVAAVCGLAVVRPAQAQNLVTNGGFETGDFTGFTVIDPDATPTSPTGNTNVTDVRPRTGSFSTQLGAVGTDGFLTQTLTTTPGGLYSIQFFLASDGEIPNDFGVLFDGVELFSAVNLPESDFIQYNFTGTATTSSTDLTFRYRNDLGFLFLDDISVTPTAAIVPEPGQVVAGGLLFGGLGIGMIRGRKRRKLA